MAQYIVELSLETESMEIDDNRQSVRQAVLDFLAAASLDGDQVWINQIRERGPND